LKKFLTIIKAFWQRSLTYRFTILTYRIGEIGEVLVLILMWNAVYGGQKMIGNFTLEEMITYILVGNFFHALVRNFLSDIVSHDIKSGKLSMFLIKPMSYFSFILTREIGRLSLATTFSSISQMLVIIFFLHTFLWNFDMSYLFIILLMIIFAFITELFISYLIGLIAFWTDEVDGLYATMDRIKKFFSGGYFPLSLLPRIFVKTSLLLPFSYSFFVPAQLYLKKIDLWAGFKGLIIQLIWIFILYGIIRFVWNRGLKKYEGVGI